MCFIEASARSCPSFFLFVENGGTEEGGFPSILRIRGFIWQFQEIVGSGGELHEWGNPGLYSA